MPGDVGFGKKAMVGSSPYLWRKDKPSNRRSLKPEDREWRAAFGYFDRNVHDDFVLPRGWNPARGRSGDVCRSR